MKGVGVGVAFCAGKVEVEAQVLASSIVGGLLRLEVSGMLKADTRDGIKEGR